MKTARATLSSAIMLMLSLLTSGALGAERDITEYSDSTNGFYPKSGILKFQSDCPEGTAFFKNVAPGLTNGGVAGSTVPPIQFIIDGKTVAVAGGHSVVLYSASNGMRVTSLPNGAASVAFSPTGTMLAAGGDDGTIRIWRAPQEGKSLNH